MKLQLTIALFVMLAAAMIAYVAVGLTPAYAECRPYAGPVHCAAFALGLTS